MNYKQIHEKRRVVSFGCSLTWGHELSDNVIIGEGQHARLDMTKFSHLTYAGLMAKYYGKEYHSNALPGGSNDTIERLIMEWTRTEDYKNDFFIIGWTSATRREYYVGGEYEKYFNFLYQATKPNQDKTIAKIQQAHDLIWDQLPDKEIFSIFCTQVLRTQVLLEHFKIPYMMINALLPIDAYYFTTKDNLWPELNILYPHTNFYSWSCEKKYPLGKFSHPLELAHQKWAKKLIEEIENE